LELCDFGEFLTALDSILLAAFTSISLCLNPFATLASFDFSRTWLAASSHLSIYPSFHLSIVPSSVGKTAFEVIAASATPAAVAFDVYIDSENFENCG